MCSLQRYFKILNEKNVYQIKLGPDTLDSFDRHIIHKVADFDQVDPLIVEASYKLHHYVLPFHFCRLSFKTSE